MRSSSASGAASCRLSRIVPVNRKPSWGMTTMRSRSVGSRHPAQVDAAEAHRAAGRVVQARHQLGERRLPGAGRADEHEPLAARERERHVAQHGVELGRVAEAHVVDLEVAAVREVDGCIGFGEVGLLVEQAVELVQRRAGLLERVEHLRELLDRLEQVVEVEHERGDHADGHVPIRREHRAETDDDRQRDALGELDDRHVDRGDLLGAAHW